jgi:hypothetical protein
MTATTPTIATIPRIIGSSRIAGVYEPRHPFRGTSARRGGSIGDSNVCATVEA